MPTGTDGDGPIRALYDERNRDSLMLHELTVALMQFHNHCARLLPDLATNPGKAYADARFHVVRVWHNIIRNDVLPRFVHPDILALPKLADAWKLDEITLQHGLFRAFHAMPLEAYHLPLSGDHPLAHLLKEDYSPSMAEDAKWQIDWPRFFNYGSREIDPSKGVPLTGLSASSAAMLSVARQDFQTARATAPLRLGSDELAAAVAALPPDLAAQCSAERLERDFPAAFPDAPSPPRKHVLEEGPLYLALLIEAQLHGTDGGFGPLGSALFRASILEAIDRVKNLKTFITPQALNVPEASPATMLDLIQLFR